MSESDPIGWVHKLLSIYTATDLPVFMFSMYDHFLRVGILGHRDTEHNSKLLQLPRWSIMFSSWKSLENITQWIQGKLVLSEKSAPTLEDLSAPSSLWRKIHCSYHGLQEDPKASNL